MADILDTAWILDAAGNSYYQPCRTGLHLCGQTPDGEQPYTAANIPATSFWQANEMFKAARRVGECEEGEADFCCDLMLSGDCDRDFWTNRQLWPAIRRELAAFGANNG